MAHTQLSKLRGPIEMYHCCCRMVEVYVFEILKVAVQDNAA